MGLLENFLLFFPKSDSRVSRGFKLLLLNSYLKHFIKESTWIFIGSTNGEVPILWPLVVKRKRPWCRERSKAKEQGSRGWDGWIASLTHWTWTWANSRRQWSTGRPGMLQFIWSKRVGHKSATEQQQLKKSVILHHRGLSWSTVISFIVNTWKLGPRVNRASWTQWLRKKFL